MNHLTPRTKPHNPVRLIAQAQPHHRLSFHPHSAIMDMPSELLLEIFTRVSKADLMALRIVCKQFAGFLVPLLFGSVLLVANAKKLEDAKLILSHFSASIKTIYISPINYPARTQSRYENAVDRGCRPEHVRFPQCHLDLGYKAYCKLRKEQQEIMATREISIVLCQFLNKAPKVSRLAIVSAPGLTTIVQEELREFCTLSDCELSLEAHSLLRLPAETASDCGTSFVPSLLLALSTSATQIREILAGAHVYSMRLPAACLKMDARQIRNLSPITSNITKLALSLDSVTPADKEVITNGTLASVLASATKLECFFLRTTTERTFGCFINGYSPFEDLLQGCRFPKLRSLLLTGQECHAESLIEFLLHSPSLRSLALRCYKLRSGSWAAVAEMLRKQPNLTNMQFCELRGGLIPDSYKHLRSYECAFIQNTLFHVGENPFLEGAVESFVQSLDWMRRSDSGMCYYGNAERDWYEKVFNVDRL